jgi:hypothetical protein
MEVYLLLDTLIRILGVNDHLDFHREQRWWRTFLITGRFTAFPSVNMKPGKADLGGFL